MHSSDAIFPPSKIIQQVVFTIHYVPILTCYFLHDTPFENKSKRDDPGSILENWREKAIKVNFLSQYLLTITIYYIIRRA